jgi:hypothetical protein
VAFIGNSVQSVPFITDTFSGNASTVNFTLTRAPAGTASIAVFISGVYQAPIAYSLTGDVITFVSAPASATNNIVVLHLGNGSATQVPSDGSVTTQTIAAGAVTGAKISNASITGDKIVANTIGSSNLTTTGVAAGVYGGSSAIPVITVDAQGRLSSASNTTITIPPSTAVFANSGQLTANASTGNVLLGLANTTVVASTYGGATNVASIIVDQFGRITSASNVAVSGIDAHPFVFTALGS